MAKIITGHRVGQNGAIRVGCSAVIFDQQRQKILLTRREDNNQWCLPSGGMESGESASEACIREVEEETGLQVVYQVVGWNPGKVQVRHVYERLKKKQVCKLQ